MVRNAKFSHCADSDCFLTELPAGIDYCVDRFLGMLREEIGDRRSSDLAGRPRDAPYSRTNKVPPCFLAARSKRFLQSVISSSKALNILGDVFLGIVVARSVREISDQLDCLERSGARLMASSTNLVRSRVRKIERPIFHTAGAIPTRLRASVKCTTQYEKSSPTLRPSLDNHGADP